jgi:hypothetical protein
MTLNSHPINRAMCYAHETGTDSRCKPAKATPGPWAASFYPGEPITGMIQPGRRQDEYHIDPPKGDKSNGVSIIASTHGPNMAANARLIAAAPDLLEALREAWNVLCYAAQESKGKVRKEIVGGWIHHAAIINSIITKAEGNS